MSFSDFFHISMGFRMIFMDFHDVFVCDWVLVGFLGFWWVLVGFIRFLRSTCKLCVTWDIVRVQPATDGHRQVFCKTVVQLHRAGHWPFYV